MNRQMIWAGVLISATGVSGMAMAGCGSPSVQLTDLGTDFAEAVVTFKAILGVPSTVTVAGRMLTCTIAFDVDVAQSFRSGTPVAISSGFPTGCVFSGAYSGWQVGSQTGLSPTGNQVRFKSTVSGAVPPIPLASTDPASLPTQVTTPGGAGVPSLSTLLSNNTVCVSTNLTSGSTAGPWNNQEWHQAGGTLTDYKLGPNPVDPTTDIGSWGISGAGASTQVNYNYTDVGVFNYSVFRNGAVAPYTYSFCNGSTEVAVGVVYQGQVSCDAGGTRK